MPNTIGEAAIHSSQPHLVSTVGNGDDQDISKDSSSYQFKNIWLFPTVASILLLLIGISAVAVVSGYAVSG